MTNLQEQALTPYRSTKVYFDVDETVMLDEAWSMTRRGNEISKLSALKVSDDQNRVNVRFWPASGCWTLSPIQQDIGAMQEYNDTLHLIIPDTGFRLINQLSATSKIATVYAWRAASDLPGQAFGAAVSASGDPFLVKSVPAGNTWNAPLSSGVTVPPGTTVDIPLDRCGESTQTFREDQGFCLRWSTPGHTQNYFTYIWSFYFGQYCVSFKGNGQTVLWENCHDSSGVLQWRRRAEFQYSRPSGIGNASQSICIFPHTGPSGNRYIAFFGNHLEVGGFLAEESRTGVDSVQGAEFLYRVNSVVTGTDRDESPNFVTRADLCRFDIRRDLRIRQQISMLGFAQFGTLVDIPEALPPRTGGGTVYVNASVTQPAGTSLTTSLNDAATGITFNPVTDLLPYVTFNFTGDGTHTPVLWAYSMVRAAALQTISPGQFTGDTLTSFSHTGAEGDPSHETANCLISDPPGALTRLRSRGQLTAKVVITVSPPSLSAYSTTIMRGSAIRPRSQRRGITGRHDGGAGAGAATLYPSAQYCDFMVPLYGMWARLYERVQEPKSITKYANDGANPPFGHNAPTPPSVAAVPWKVTDAIRDLLLSAGFPASQINIIDLDKRLWPGHTAQVAEYQIDPCTNLAEVIVRMCRNYLGAYLYYDPNAGTAGQWRLLQPPQPVAGLYTPVWNFTTTPPTGKIPSLPQSYPANTYFCQEEQRYTVPPDFNLVRVVTSFGNRSQDVRIENTLYNPLSYNVPGMSVTANPDDTAGEYLGRPRPLLVIDPTLAVAGDGAATQRNVDWTAIRLFNFLCHAQVIQPFSAPVPIFADPENPTKYRVPRFQDPVTFNGSTFILRNMNMQWSDDKRQMASYEAVMPIPL